jgi:hypothetical protein
MFQYTDAQVRKEAAERERIETNHRHANQELRDRFAIAALTGMMASPALMEHITGQELVDGSALDRMAHAAYRQADAMMKARERK